MEEVVSEGKEMKRHKNTLDLGAETISLSLPVLRKGEWSGCLWLRAKPQCLRRFRMRMHGLWQAKGGVSGCAAASIGFNMGWILGILP